MSFANAGALLWFLPLAGSIVLLYILRMRRKDLRVPATFLWPQKTYEVRANTLFQKLRFNWLMVLQLLALLAIVVGFARPQVRQQGLGGAVTVVVLDTSASMSATDVKPSRFDEALKLCTKLIDSVRPMDRLSLVEAGPTPRVVFPLSNDPGRMRASLRSVSKTDAEGEMGEALRLAASLASKTPGARIVVLSDGAFPQVTNFTPGKATVTFQKIGRDGENLAISALGTSESGEGRQLYCAVKNFGKIANEATVTVKADGKVYNSFKVQVAPGNLSGKTMDAPANAKVIEAELKANDALASDNYAVTVTDPGATIRTLVVGKGDIFLEKALALDPRVVLDRATSLPSGAEYDLIVFDGVAEVKTSAKAVLTLGAAGPSSPVKKLGTLAKPAADVAAQKHPLMNSVDLTGVYIESAERVEPTSDGEVVAQIGNSPLVVVRRAAQRQAYLAFQPMESDFPLQVSFPIFLSNALDFLVPRESRTSALAVPAGKPFSVPASTDSELKLDTPSGPDHSIKARSGMYIVREAKTIGKYTYDMGKGARAVYASLQSESESNITPQDKLMLGSSQVQASGTVSRLADYWRPLLLLALLVLAGEWWLFARRS